MDIIKVFGTNVKHYRQQTGLSQEDNVKGKLMNDEQFEMMSQNYEAEHPYRI